MKKYIVLSLMLFVISSNISGQEIKNYASVTRLTGHGKINNTLDISITIDLIPRVDYTKTGCVSKHYNQISGKYRYNNQDESISLIGEQISWYFDRGEIDTLIIFELNAQFERTAQFIGQLNKNGFTGTWKNLKTSKAYPFYIKFNSDNSGNLSISWKNKTTNLIGFNNNLNQSTYKVVKQIEKIDSLIIVMETSEPCCGLYNCRGTNCGGSDDFVYLYLLTDNSVKYFKEKIGSGCDWEETKERMLTADKYSIVTENDSGEQFFVTIDYNNLGQGIIKRKR